MLKLVRFLKGYWFKTISGPFFKLTEAVFELITPLVVAWVIDSAIPAGQAGDFYSLSTGIDVQTVSKKTGVAPRNLAYMYKKASRQVHLEWKPYSEWKQELDRVYIRCRNYAALLTHSQECGGQNFKNVVIVVREQDIPSECVDLLITPLGNLDINFRVLRALRKYNIYQLEDLLRFIKYNGFDALCRIPGIGMKSVEQLYKNLKERKILEDKETCMLFRYLFV